jgi:Tfp pilus assembly protein PilO
MEPDYKAMTLEQLNNLLYEEEEKLHQTIQKGKAHVRAIRRIRDDKIEHAQTAKLVEGLTPSQKEHLSKMLSQNITPGSAAGSAAAGNA